MIRLTFANGNQVEYPEGSGTIESLDGRQLIVVRPDGSAVAIVDRASVKEVQ